MSILDLYPPEDAAFDPASRGYLYHFDPQYAYTAIREFHIYEVTPSSEHGGESAERKLHKRFAALRVHGEWFHLEGDLSAYIQSLQKGQL